MGLYKILVRGGLLFSLVTTGNVSHCLAGGVVQGGRVIQGTPNPNPKAFERALPRHRHSQGMCARAVRVAVEELTGRKLERRDYAKEYGEPLLKTGCYVRSSANVQPRNYDVRILLPKRRNHYGHIEVFYRGTWYSDFRQPGSLWTVWPKEYSRIQHYRFVAQTSSAPSIRRAIPVQGAQLSGTPRANLRGSVPTKNTRLF
ncbi:MAG: hypothetical protein PHP75_05215 [Methylacidiphilaceae bacterium]|nr:hypothetical protein [Candidatus Methylacidiphilaceae bacterium]